MKSNFLLKSLMILLLGTISFSFVACAENGDDFDDSTPPAEQNGFELEDDDTTGEDGQPGDPGTGQQQ
jgi:hypothetical protein